MPLGWFDNLEIEQKEISLEKDDRLFLFTDGITECRNSNVEMFGIDRFYEFIENNIALEPEEFSSKLLKVLKNFSGQDTFEDDLCLIVLDVL